MKLSSLINSVHTIKQNLNAKSVKRQFYTAEKSDTFIRTTNPLNSGSSLSVETNGNIPKDFYNAITSIIQSFPSKWINLFKQNNYRIILTDDMNQIIKKHNIKISSNNNAQTTLGLTYTNPKTNQNFFCFSSKINPQYLPSIVNHEFGHGVFNIKKLYDSNEIKTPLSEDIKSIIKERKLDKLSEEERQLLSNYFFNKRANMPIDEIFADLFACSQNGGGCYGSGLMLSKENQNLMTSLFPNLYSKIKTL